MTQARSDKTPDELEITDKDDLGSQYHCSSERHLSLCTPPASWIHSFALHACKVGGIPGYPGKRVLIGSAAGLAEYFQCNEKTILRGLQALATSGFFVVLKRRWHRPTAYEVLTH